MGEKVVTNLEDLQTSDLPLATVGLPSPLVIDLPDGQKLVISNLDPGTVIEVATWRGTGRPDSRTNRLMLGVSATVDEPSESELPHTKRFSRSKNSSPQLHTVTSETEPNTFKADVPVSYSLPVNNPVEEEIKHERALTHRISPRGFVKFGVSTLAGVLIFVGLIGPGQLRVAHPQSGVASSLGSAVHSLIILKQGSSAKVGDAVIADISDPKSSPVLAVVNAVDKNNYLLATNSEQFQSLSEKIHGKVLFVIPYLGFFATLINK